MAGKGVEQRVPPVGVGLCRARAEPLKPRIPQHLGGERLQKMADPSRPERLPSLDPGDGCLVAGYDGQPHVGVKDLRHRADHRPPFGVWCDQRRKRSSGDEAGVVVLDQQQPGKRVEEASKGRNPILVERGAEGILGAGHDHHCFRSLRQRGFECPGDDSLLVHRHRHGDQAEREQDVPDRRIGRILDHDPVARPEVGLEEALDGVQRAGDDGYLEPAPSGL